MPTLHGVLPDSPGPMSPCRWCGAPTDLCFAPEGSRVGPVPLHILCGAAFIQAYQRAQRGLALSARDQGRMTRFLGSGHATPSS